MDKTSNGIEYVDELAGMLGARFWLYPIKGVHTQEDVAQAKAELRRERDVVGLKIEWKNENRKSNLKKKE